MVKRYLTLTINEKSLGQLLLMDLSFDVPYSEIGDILLIDKTEDGNDEKTTDEQTKGKKKGLKSSAAKALSRLTQLLTE